MRYQRLYSDSPMIATPGLQRRIDTAAQYAKTNLRLNCRRPATAGTSSGHPLRSTPKNPAREIQVKHPISAKRTSNHRSLRGRWLPAVACLTWALQPVAAHGQTTRQLTIVVRDTQGQDVPCRVHLADSAGRPQQAAGLPFWKDHFVCSGRATLNLPAGLYTYAVERGPEHERLTGSVRIAADRNAQLALTLKRISHLNRQGWYSGDLHIHRPYQDVPLLMQAEDLNVGPVITWWNRRNPWQNQELPRPQLQRFDGNRFYDILAGEDEREGGALLFFHLQRPIDITQSTREYPSPMTYVNQARKANSRVWIDIEKPFWWDVPVWVASGQVDSIGIANNHMCRSRMYESEAWGKPRDAARLPAPRGNGFWTQEIYYHLLNCGIRLPPSAGSASGVLPNPVGYNRVYVHLPGALSYDAWWRGLKAGRSFVTNGPLLLVRANGQRPGHVFRAPQSPLQIDLDLTVVSQDHVSQLELIRDGDVVQTIKLEDRGTQTTHGRLAFQRSGWFLIRAITSEKRTFRFASTAPFYVEIAERPAGISRRSARFFVDWVTERMQRVTGNVTDELQRAAILKHHTSARQFWQDIQNRGTRD